MDGLLAADVEIEAVVEDARAVIIFEIVPVVDDLGIIVFIRAHAGGSSHDAVDLIVDLLFHAVCANVGRGNVDAGVVEEVLVGGVFLVVDTLGNGKVGDKLVVVKLHRCIEVDLHDASEVHGDVTDAVIDAGFIVVDRDESNTVNLVGFAASDGEFVAAVIACKGIAGAAPSFRCGGAFDPAFLKSLDPVFRDTDGHRNIVSIFRCGFVVESVQRNFLEFC